MTDVQIETIKQYANLITHNYMDHCDYNEIDDNIDNEQFYKFLKILYPLVDSIDIYNVGTYYINEKIIELLTNIDHPQVKLYDLISTRSHLIKTATVDENVWFKLFNKNICINPLSITPVSDDLQKFLNLHFFNYI